MKDEAVTILEAALEERLEKEFGALENIEYIAMMSQLSHFYAKGDDAD